MRRQWRFLLPVLFMLHPLILQSRPGGDTVPIIDMGVGGRALALGGAYTALADDATAIVYNPA